VNIFMYVIYIMSAKASGVSQYCGFGAVPRGKTRASEEYCVSNKQIRYYGIEEIKNKELLKKVMGSKKRGDMQTELMKLRKLEYQFRGYLRDVKELIVLINDEKETPAKVKRHLKRKETLIKKLKAIKEKYNIQLAVVEEMEKEGEKEEKERIKKEKEEKKEEEKEKRAKEKEKRAKEKEKGEKEEKKEKKSRSKTGEKEKKSGSKTGEKEKKSGSKTGEKEKKSGSKTGEKEKKSGSKTGEKEKKSGSKTGRQKGGISSMSKSHLRKLSAEIKKIKERMAKMKKEEAILLKSLKSKKISS